ncbi:MAG: cytochrome c biogenesis protein ResB, partial [Tannerella sp.]|nr:cytochrome c biogenesis protein ResB [Tannerella sp.]
MRKLSFVILFIITVLLATTTFIEARFGTPFVQSHFYGSWWMITLWALMAVSAMTLIMKMKKPVMAFHCSLLLILVGAGITHFTGEQGQIHLRTDGKAQASMRLPFELKLNRFETEYYRGTTTAADYVSYVTVIDGLKSFDAVVSMNNILKYRGYRFYQASFDSDSDGTVLAVSHDPVGIAVTYAGYIVLALSMLWLLVGKKSGFRRLIKSLGVTVLIFNTLTANALIASALTANARTIPRTLTVAQSHAFGSLSMLHNGRIMPVDTYARDFTKKITGKSSYKDFNAVQVLAGWLLFNDDWQEEKMLKINDKAIRKYMGGEEKYRFSDFFTGGVYKLMYAGLSVEHKGMREADEKLGLLMSMRNGAGLTIFPDGNRWYASD